MYAPLRRVHAMNHYMSEHANAKHAESLWRSLSAAAAAAGAPLSAGPAAASGAVGEASEAAGASWQVRAQLHVTEACGMRWVLNDGPLDVVPLVQPQEPPSFSSTSATFPKRCCFGFQSSIAWDMWRQCQLNGSWATTGCYRTRWTARGVLSSSTCHGTTQTSSWRMSRRRRKVERLVQLTPAASVASTARPASAAPARWLCQLASAVPLSQRPGELLLRAGCFSWCRWCHTTFPAVIGTDARRRRSRSRRSRSRRSRSRRSRSRSRSRSRTGQQPAASSRQQQPAASSQQPATSSSSSSQQTATSRQQHQPAANSQKPAAAANK